MPGYNPQVNDPKVLTGNQCAILVGDVVVGFGQSSDPNISFGAETLYGIGSAKPQDIPQLKLGPTISLNSYALTDAALASLGSDTPWASILANNRFNIHVMTSTGKPFLTFVGCVAESVSFSIPANQPVTQNTSFQAMDVLDRDGVSVLRSNDAATFGVSGGGTTALNFTGTLAL